MNAIRTLSTPALFSAGRQALRIPDAGVRLRFQLLLSIELQRRQRLARLLPLEQKAKLGLLRRHEAQQLERLRRKLGRQL